MSRKNRPEPPRGEATEERDRRPRPGARKHDWADEAAQARTADDIRAVAPHDAAGTPSTGDTR